MKVQNSLSARRWGSIVMLTIVALSALVFTDHYYRKLVQAENEQTLERELLDIQNRLELAIETQLYSVKDLQAFMLASSELPNEEIFNRYAAAVLDHYPEVRALQYADDERIIRYIYPLEGNEAALNLDLMTRPAAPFVEKAIQQRHITVADPEHLVQGILGIVARAPLYRDDQFLGLTQSVFDVPIVVENALTGADTRFDIQLYDSKGQLFWGPKNITGETRSTFILAGNNIWYLNLGWTPHPPEPFVLMLIWILGGTLLISLIFIVNRAWIRVGWLHFNIENKTRALRKQEALLFEAQRIGKVGHAEWQVASDELICSEELLRIFAFPTEERIIPRKMLEERLHPDDRQCLLESDRRTLENHADLDYEYRLLLPNNQVCWVHQLGMFSYDEAGSPVRMLSVFQDITKRKEAELALRESENRFRMTFLVSPDSININRLEDGLYVDINEGFTNITRYERAEIIGKTSVEINIWENPSDREKLVEGLKEHGYVNNQEAKFRLKNGQVITGLISAQIIIFDNTPHILSITRNIEEIKVAEDALRRSEERFRAIAANTPDHIFMHDAELRYLTVINPQFGITEEQMLGKTDYDFLPKDEAEVLINAKRKVIKNGKPMHFETSLMAKNGEAALFDGTFMPTFDSQGKTNGLIGYFRDITERREALNALQKSEEKYRKLFYSLVTGFAQHEIICNKVGEPIDYRFLEINPAFERLTGLKTEETVGRTLLEIAPQTERYWIDTYGRVALTGETIQFENYARTFDKHYQVTAYSPQKGQFCTIFLDISDRKKAEIEVEKSRQRLHALTNYLQTAIERERSYIARELHDEFGQTLTGLKMDLSWLARNFEEGSEALERTKAMDTLIDQAIQTTRRISSDLRPGLLDDLGLLPALEWLSEEFNRRTKIPCSIKLPDEDPALDPDLTTALFRIYQEILTNISRHAQASTVKACLSKNKDELKMEVIDDGRGISSSEQSDFASLGLLGMQERAALWRGNVLITGEAKKGTTVLVKIPMPATRQTELWKRE